MNILKFLCEIDSNPKLAATIAIVAMSAIILGCAIWLIVKKLVLKKRYKADDELVEEYNRKLKERRKAEKEDKARPETIEENF